MKAKLTIILLLSSIFLVSFNVNAMTTGFQTETISEERTEKILNNLDFSVEETEKSFNSISCFDISDNELIAIGVDDGYDKFINIYDENETFKYGYSFTDYGSFGFEFDNDNLIVYLVRSDLAVLLDREGKCLSIESILNTTDNNYYWNHSVFAKVKEHNDDKYYQTNGNGFLRIFSPSYSQLIKVSPDGTKTIIFNKSTDYSIVNLLTIIVFILIMSIVIFKLVRLIKISKDI